MATEDHGGGTAFEEGCQCNFDDQNNGKVTEDCRCEEETAKNNEECFCEDEEKPTDEECYCNLEDKNDEEWVENPVCECDGRFGNTASAPAFRIHDCLGENKTVSAAGYRIAPRFIPRRSHVVVVYRNGLDVSDKMMKIHPISTSVKVLKQIIGRLLSLEPKNIVLVKNDVVLKDNYPIGDVKATNLNYVEITIKTKDDTKFCLKSIPKDKYIEELVIADVCTKRDLEYVVVKFRIRFQGDTFTSTYAPSTTIYDLRHILGKTFGCDPDNLDVYRHGLIVPDARQLICLDYDDFGNIDMEIVTRDCTRLNMDRIYKPDDVVSDVLKVFVDIENKDKTIEINVEIIDKRIKKPFLGGYRNTQTGDEYHHAYTQCIPKMDKVPGESKYTRITQTQPEMEKRTNTLHTTATQMTKADLYIPCMFDYVIVPGQYETYDEMVKRLRHEHYASIIQRAYRAYRYRKLILNWLKRCKERAEKIRQEEEAERLDLARRVNRDVTTKTFPRTKEDFDQLYAMVDRWKHNEIERISKLHNRAPRIAEFILLLDKEVELLRAIENYKFQLKDDLRKIRDQKFLEEISKPVVWTNKLGRMVAMDTVEAQRARKLKKIYNEFCKKIVSIEDRIALLVDMKNALQVFLHPLTEQIISLIDRECELLIRSCKDSDLEFLRERIRASFLQFIKTSELNAGIVRRKNKLDYKEMENFSTYVCKMCNKVKPWKKFYLDNKMNEMNICNKCSMFNMTSRPWADTTPYSHLLRNIQREERRNKCWGSLAFVLQVSDIYFLVDTIWHSKSAISECDDMYLLRLCKWHVKEDWSPWNCFLVTLEEMKAHEKLERPEDVYDEELVIDVHNKHATAKVQFHQLSAIENRLVGRGRWHKVRASSVDWTKGMKAL